MALEKKAFDKMVKYKTQMEQFCYIIKLNRSQLFAKIINKLKKQNKEIEE